jgi:aspartate aminotransferase
VYVQTILVGSLSKAYAMTGWRVGYTAAPKEIIRAMDGLQSQETSNPTSIAQRAAVAALTGPQESVYQMRDEFDRRRRYIVGRLNAMPGIRCLSPQGAFYVFPNVSGMYGKHYAGTIIRNSNDVATYLLEAARIAVVPGIEFGSGDHIRISYATSLENIQKGMDRMAEAVRQLG